MYKVLYQAGHGARAQALANVTAGGSCDDIDAAAPAAVPGLTTLAFWGHGDAFKLCGKTPREIHEIIKAWKALNGGLSTVEIITCNGRHNVAGDGFANQLKSGIGPRSSLHGLKIMGLPVSVAGTNNAWSILLAETIHNSWAYITAPGADDSELMRAKTKFEFETLADGRSVSYRGDLAVKADELVREDQGRAWTVNYGYMNTLRSHLVKV